jgi:hypothetical protein
VPSVREPDPGQGDGGGQRAGASQRCRRAAYEERRAAAAGAIAVKVVETVTTTEHGLDECVRRVQSSPVAVRKVLTHLTKLLGEEGLRDPKWGSAVDYAVSLAREAGLTAEAPCECTRGDKSSPIGTATDACVALVLR